MTVAGAHTGLQLRDEPFDGPAGAQLVAELTADLMVRYADLDAPPVCTLDGDALAARRALAEQEEAEYTAELTAADVAPPVGAFVVAYLDGVPVGCGALRRWDDDTGELKRLWVDPARRGRGVARALVARLEGEAVALGYTSIRLETGDRQPEAMCLYETLGYRRIDPYGHYKDSPHTACFERALVPEG